MKYANIYIKFYVYGGVLRKDISFPRMNMLHEKNCMFFKEQIMTNMCSFENWGILPGYSPVLAGKNSVLCHI